MSKPEPFKDFLKDKKVLIVDQSSTIRSSVAQAVAGFGVQSLQIITASSYDEAINNIKSDSNVGLLITDYVIGNRSGVELASEVFSNETNIQSFATVILTSNSHQSHVAEAAEGLVDAYILKPFSADILKKYLGGTVEKKLNPSQGSSTLSGIRSLLRQKNYQEAVQTVQVTFELTRNSRPVQLCIYGGQAHEALGELPKALEWYTTALSYKKDNYFGLLGVYSIHKKSGNKDKAYDAISYLAGLFPLSAIRLCDVVALAVETSHFDDVEKYYSLFLDIDERREDLVRTMAAALVIGGIHNFQNGRSDRGVDLFRKAIVTSKRDPKVIFRSVLYCLAYEQYSFAKEFYDKFEAHNQSDLEYLTIQFLMIDLNAKGDDIERNLSLGIRLTENPKSTIQIFRVLLKRCTELKREKLYDQIRELGLRRFRPEVLDLALYTIGEGQAEKISVAS